MQNQIFFFYLFRVKQKKKFKLNEFFAVIVKKFCSRNDATGKDIPASDLDGIVNELLEE